MNTLILRLRLWYWTWQLRRGDARLQRLIRKARRRGMPTLPDAAELTRRVPWPR